jgi:O-antigen/teichoic acid export membrane protein
VGTMLTVLTNRMGRIIDRSRVLEDRLEIANEERWVSELDILYGRAHLINYAITLATACGLSICLIIAMLFLGDTTNLPLDQYIAILFVLAMVALVGSFAFFLREIFIASRHMRLAHVARRALHA